MRRLAAAGSLMDRTTALDLFLPHMRDVGKCEQSLHELNLNWRMIESAAKLNCPLESQAILPAMAATRATFRQLEDELGAQPRASENVQHAR